MMKRLLFFLLAYFSATSALHAQLLPQYGVQFVKARPALAIKTNLLYDLAITPSIEVEIPLARNISIQAEFARGWWLKKHTHCWQVENYGVELRYWLGGSYINRNHDRALLRPQQEEYLMRTLLYGDATPPQPAIEYMPGLQGWFVGLFASSGFYDFQFHTKRGTQAETYVPLGVSFGYSQKLNNNLHIEYSAGFGLTTLDLHYYKVYDNKVLYRRKNSQRKVGFFPAKARVSLVWVLHKKDYTKKRMEDVLFY